MVRTRPFLEEGRPIIATEQRPNIGRNWGPARAQAVEPRPGAPAEGLGGDRRPRRAAGPMSESPSSDGRLVDVEWSRRLDDPENRTGDQRVLRDAGDQRVLRDDHGRTAVNRYWQKLRHFKVARNVDQPSYRIRISV